MTGKPPGGGTWAGRWTLRTRQSSLSGGMGPPNQAVIPGAWGQATASWPTPGGQAFRGFGARNRSASA